MTRVELFGTGYEGTRLREALVAAVRLAGTGEAVEFREYGRADSARIAASAPADRTARFAGSEYLINATNDDQHDAVLDLLHHADGFVVSEKPLVAPDQTVAEGWSSAWSGRDRFALNTIERYSAAVSYVRDRVAAAELRVARVNFVWAKNRFDDPRPTVGVVSEVIHPLDLAVHLVGGDLAQVRLSSATVIESDYAAAGTVLPESAQIAFEVGGAVVTGYSSFGHPSRSRVVEITAEGARGEREYFELRFDDPAWDYDRLRHWSTAGTVPPVELDFTPPADGSPVGAAKLVRFWLDVLDGRFGRRYAGFDDAVQLQRLLGEISRSVRAEAVYGGGQARSTLDRLDSERLG
ncbi:hypothetical protein TSST111916_10310 [Tsukamurella strandjordii]|uniref:hypothetical protein n=1 Tax=Tsukamurella TaxID=2060 RepID=UPI001C7CD511|nr:hypothetical protein [Tsukamurella sp. TY48]GIZ97015.1 hypothetical protein TTY48_16270 [Tsukamurella sp. TY48]